MKRWLVARRIVQVTVLALFTAPLFASGWMLFGLTQGREQGMPVPADLPFFGSLSSSTVAQFVLFDPFAVLEVIVASKTLELSWLIGAAAVLVFYTVIGARAFCGWVCPVNLLLEGVDWLRAKLGVPTAERVIWRHAKRVMAAGVLLVTALTGKLVFEALSPISTIGKGILFGSFAGIVVLLAIVVVELLYARRVWCRSLCPVGALYELMGRFGIFKVRINHAACTGCGRCQKVCLASPEILNDAINGSASRVTAGDCMRCGACVDACPETALTLTAKVCRAPCTL